MNAISQTACVPKFLSHSSTSLHNIRFTGFSLCCVLTEVLSVCKRVVMARQLLTFGILPSLALSTVLTPRQDCSANFKICSPPGATKNTLGSIGPGWDSLYNDIINVVNGYSIDDAPVTTSVDPNGPARRDMAFCCEWHITG